MSAGGKSRRVVTAAAAATIAIGVTMAALAPVSVADTPTEPAARGKSPQTVQVSGQLIPVNLDTGTYKVIGELIGTWTFPAAETSTYYQSDTRLYQQGTEYFDGCINLNGNTRCDSSEPNGRWRSDYIYWASYDRGGRLIEGGCTHALNGGNKAYTGIRGLLHMRDVYASTPAGSTASYQGEIILNAADEKPLIAQPAPNRLNATSTTDRATAGC